MPIFRSAVQGRLLAVLYASPDEEFSVSELARRTQAHVATLQREVERLSAAGILLTRRSGATRLVRPNPDSPYASDLSSLVMRSFGPVHVLGQLLSTLEGVEEAFAYGSWAERYQGIDGPRPSDIDVLVIGDVDKDQLYAVAQQAGTSIGTPIQLIARKRRSWHEDRSGFSESVRHGARVEIPLRL